jgi:RNA polymerase-binding transcription factor DksA
MADDADMANEYIDSEVSRALGRLRQQNIKNAPVMGSSECKECGEKIPEQRRSLGFQFCIVCAEEMERRQSLFADR